MKEKSSSIWEIVKFMAVSSVVTILQIVLVNVLFYLLKDFKHPLPHLLQLVFNENNIGKDNMHWGYVLPFLLSNIIANAYGYFQNKKTTFHANPPKKNFYIYITVIIILIFVSTFLQGVIVNYVTSKTTLSMYAPTIATIITGWLQFLILFPLEKFYLLKPVR